jgi:hypothetical protein
MWSGERPSDMDDTEEGDVGNGMFKTLLGSNFVEAVTLVNALLIITPVDVLDGELTSWLLLLLVSSLPDFSKMSS